MPLLSLELNDAELILARQTAEGAEVAAASEGYAVLDESAVLTGEAARQRARLKPLYSHNRFWRELSVADLPRPDPRARTNADLAFAHISNLLSSEVGRVEGILLALPAGYSREQLGLLLGVIGETGVAVAGIVDAAVAATAAEPVGERALHLDLELHFAVLTTLERGAELQRGHSELLARHGMLSLQEAWVETIAATFVRRTRFDPLHEARNEQALWNRLDGWLDELSREESIEVRLSEEQATHSVELARADLLTAAAARYDGLVSFVRKACPAGVATDVVISDRAARAQGLAERLAELPGVRVHRLSRGAAALGALRFAEQIRRPAGQLTLVTRLPAAQAAAAPRRVEFRVPAVEQPTHLVYEGRALAISGVPLAIGWSVPAGGRALRVPAAPGVSRVHCRVSRRDGHALLEDQSTYGTFVNDNPVRGVVALRLGDRLRLGSPGVNIELIQLVDDHGAPQL